MRRFFKSIAIFGGTVGLALGLAAMAPAHAAGPANAASNARAALAPLSVQAVDAEVQLIHDHRRWRGDRRHWHRDRRHRPGHRHHYRSGPSFSFHFGPPPRYHAPPPRYRHAPPRHAYRLPASHVRWCHNRYRSYRASDNTFQPYHGPRRQCRSPYF